MISANGGLLAHRYTPQVTPRWPRGSEPASVIVDTEIVNLQYIHKTPMLCCGLRQKQYCIKKTSEFSLQNRYDVAQSNHSLQNQTSLLTKK